MVSGDTLTGTYSGVFDNANVGTSKTVTITSSYGGTDVNNYTITDQASTTADVTAKALTATASESNKTYDATNTATATLTITVTGINEAPDAVDDTDTVAEDATVTKTGSEDDVLNDDTADSDGLVITHIKKDGGTNSTVASGSTYVSNGTSVTGTYGTLTIGADGSYTYVADQAAADALDAGDQVNDIFVYTCLLYTSPSPRDVEESRMPSSA